MNYLNQLLPTDLANIIKEYTYPNYKDQYEKVIKNIDIFILLTFSTRDSNHIDNWLRAPRIYLTQHYSDEKLLTNAYKRGSTLTYMYPTQYQKKYNNVLDELINTFGNSYELTDIMKSSKKTTYKTILYFLRNKKDSSNYFIIHLRDINYAKLLKNHKDGCYHNAFSFNY